MILVKDFIFYHTSKPLGGHLPSLPPSLLYPVNDHCSCRQKPPFVNSKPTKIVALLCTRGCYVQSCAPFTRFVVDCVQTARKGFEAPLWMATELLLLMGRNLEETSGRMISNRNPHSRHTSAGPWGDVSICSKVSIWNTNQLCSVWGFTAILLPFQVKHLMLNNTLFSQKSWHDIQYSGLKYKLLSHRVFVGDQVLNETVIALPTLDWAR